MQLHELPRDASGVILGAWKLRHRSPSFEAFLVTTSFVAGETNAPLRGVVLQRVMAAFGDVVEAEPWPEVPQTDVEATAVAIADVAVAGQTRKIVSPQISHMPTPRAAIQAPTTRAELVSLSEAEARVLVAAMGEAQGAKSWKLNQMRRFIAEEVGIE